MEYWNQSESREVWKYECEKKSSRKVSDYFVPFFVDFFFY